MGYLSTGLYGCHRLSPGWFSSASFYSFGEAADLIASSGDEAFEEVDHGGEGIVGEAGLSHLLYESEFFTSELLEFLVLLFELFPSNELLSLGRSTW